MYSASFCAGRAFRSEDTLNSFKALKRKESFVFSAFSGSIRFFVRSSAPFLTPLFITSEYLTIMHFCAVVTFINVLVCKTLNKYIITYLNSR